MHHHDISKGKKIVNTNKNKLYEEKILDLYDINANGFALELHIRFCFKSRNIS